MKRMTSILFCAIFILLCVAGCSYDRGRIAYNIKLSKYEKCMETVDYIGIKVDKNSAQFAKKYGEIIEIDVSKNNFYAKKTEGVVQAGDTINIDYFAKKDSEPIAKVKSDNLLWSNVGSNPLFIDGCKIEGFDEALIGAAIGKTFDLDLTFPGSYPDASLADKNVVFTITINYVDSDEMLDPEEYFDKLGFKTYEDYVENLEIRATKAYLIEYVVEKAKIKKYPKYEEKRLYDDFSLVYDSDAEAINQMLEYAGETAEDFESDVMEFLVHPIIEQQMPVYYIFDKENLSYTNQELKTLTDATLKDCAVYDITKSDLTTEYGANYFEYLVIKQKVENFLYKNAKIVE